MGDVIPFPGAQGRPGETVPGETVPGETVPGETVPGGGPGAGRPGGVEPDEGASVADLGGLLARRLIEDAGGPAAAWAAMQGMLGGGDAGPFGSLLMSRHRPPKLHQRRPDKAIFVVRVDLDGAKPPIWRRLRLASDLTLTEVHEIVQVAMGWTDSHLHCFRMGSALNHDVAPFLTDYDIDVEGETEGIPESEVRLDEVLAEPGDQLFYEYDFGDDWRHTLKLEKVEAWVEDAPAAVCVTGRRACPPEDVGGVWSYQELLEALSGDVDPDQAEWMAERLEWLPEGFDPAAFDLDEVNESLAFGSPPELEDWRPEIVELLERAGGSRSPQVGALANLALAEPPDCLSADEAERATLRYRTLLDIVGDGVKLTAAGYLPPRVVDEVFTELNLDSTWIGKGNREDQTYPVLSLRESATGLGLLRKAKGVLTVTTAGRKLASDPGRLFAHIASRLPLGRDYERDAGLLCLLFAAAERDWYDERREAAAIFATLGWSSEDLERAVYQAGRPTMEVLDHLVGRRGVPEWRATVARALLARRG